MPKSQATDTWYRARWIEIDFPISAQYTRRTRRT